MTTPQPTCRTCPNDVALTPVLDLGEHPISTFVRPDEPNDQPRSPLQLGLCPVCTTVQLQHTVDPEYLYREYWYLSGVNVAMRTELRDIVQQALARVPILELSDYVLDIGANDGTLLSYYEEICGDLRPLRVAYEPAWNLRESLVRHTEVRHDSFFPPPEHTDHGHPFKIVTSIAMFYDLQDPNAFVHAVKMCLHRDGLWVIQLQDLTGMLGKTAFDNICHEHLQYYSLYSLKRVLQHNALEIYDVEHRAINSGSLRVSVGHRTPPPWVTVEARERVLDQLAREDRHSLLDPDGIRLRFQRFETRLQQIRKQLRGVIDSYGSVDGYGASTKGNTLLPVCGLNNHDVARIAERSTAKVGLETVGTRIPIVSEAEWRTDPQAATLVPIWQFRDGVIDRERAYLEQGGALIFPLPEVEIVRG